MNRVLPRAARPIRRLIKQVGRGGRPYHLPKELLPNDLFLVSLPRSGSSWTRLLIANYLTGGECSPDQLDSVLPDIHEDPSISEKGLSPRFIKSHMPFVPEYGRVVYLARDGRDVAVSYYYWHLRQGVLFESWLENAPSEFLVSRYEDQREDPTQALLRIVEFAGLEVDPSLAQLAVSRSSIGTWRAAEASVGELASPESGSGSLFARSGTVGSSQTTSQKARWTSPSPSMVRPFGD